MGSPYILTRWRFMYRSEVIKNSVMPDYGSDVLPNSPLLPTARGAAEIEWGSVLGRGGRALGC
jgi:hypothetical protein